MSSTTSTAHRGYFCRALYLPRSDNKLVQDVSVVLSLGFFCRALQLLPFDDKLVQDISVVLSLAFFAERCIYALLSTNGWYFMHHSDDKLGRYFNLAEWML